jgi:hypothetical protein
MALCLLWVLEFSTEAKAWIQTWYEAEQSLYKEEANVRFS